MLCAYSENRVRPELSIPATGQKDRGLWGREWLDDVLTKSHMRRTLALENFTSARRRRAISLSMLKVPNNIAITVQVNTP